MQQCGIIRVPYEILKQIIQKAGVHLARSKEATVTTPVANTIPEHYIESEWGSPYVVKTKSSKRYRLYYERHGNCISCAAYRLCSHNITVAQLEGNAETFIYLYKMIKQGSANILMLSHMELPLGRGTK